MDIKSLEKIANDLVAEGKGILAADESNGTMSNRLEAVGIKASEISRREYRVNLLSSPGYENSISGVILYDETITQLMDNGETIPEAMTQRGVYPGIKVDTGAKELANHKGEKITEGLDNLRERCINYYKLGARFAKWRAVIRISDNIPSEACIKVNAHALARYAAICQEQGLVPIIEPEVLMDGNHSSKVCFDITSKVLAMTFLECSIQGVHLQGAILKPNMILPGISSSEKITREEVANLTVKCLIENVPKEIAGIAFLSGGQSDEDATAHLNIMNKMNDEYPWELSYSYGRALQAAALKEWAEGTPLSSQEAFLKRAFMNHKARTGEWDPELE
ncbi:MAG: fructose-bisphosphate aldolase class I [Euryarchaeota archaeon]|jgi:fructose-bisphosphate aldolase, class I|nr:fructose-bisphosphate aldolase class I [Euryarchaeota archaeon]MBT4391867.1 fructose-bisphosphate aldolase class I [Euryarchaeota archaeon]MBT4802963.1 fructose-bisphosphate aldolase class I [Euryarchaeota archaeon]MBT5613827.1 fructose-bisphosphate aldolase class I [Euryarchaeota archaeon]MBT6683493.1 fructose-bisphosphate aldolase class I [Euryarchaeota archaeon]